MGAGESGEVEATSGSVEAEQLFDPERAPPGYLKTQSLADRDQARKRLTAGVSVDGRIAVLALPIRPDRFPATSKVAGSGDRIALQLEGHVERWADADDGESPPT
jgi:hypothetical protein